MPARTRARGEPHVAERHRVRPASGQVDREHRTVEERQQPVPAPAVEAAAVDQDDRGHGALPTPVTGPPGPATLPTVERGREPSVSPTRLTGNAPVPTRRGA